MPSDAHVSTAGTWCFPGETTEFLRNLRTNNNRDWFKQNKSAYDLYVKQPADQFCALMTNELLSLTGLNHRSKVFRVYRDVRFSKDKTPYNTHLHISFFPQTSGGQSPVWFFGLEPDLLTFGAGIFTFDKSMLDVYRNNVDGLHGKSLARVIGILKSQGARVSEPELKRVPASFDKDHEFAENLRRKGLTAWQDSNNTSMANQPDLIKATVASFDRLKPLVDWFKLLTPE